MSLPGLPISPALGDHAGHVVVAVALVVHPAAAHDLLKILVLEFYKYIDTLLIILKLVSPLHEIRIPWSRHG